MKKVFQLPGIRTQGDYNMKTRKIVKKVIDELTTLLIAAVLALCFVALFFAAHFQYMDRLAGR